jgi:exonuclease III
MYKFKNWSILCWNIRGLNGRDKHLALRNAITSSGCSVICLQETKKMHFDKAFIKQCCPSIFDEFVYVPSVGASGGLIIIWQSSMFSGMVMHCTSFALSVYFTSVHNAQSLTIVNIYGPCDGENREVFIKWLFDLNIPDDED